MSQFEGFPIFQLILNLPCLSLEESDKHSSSGRHNKKQWVDLPYLPLEASTGRISNRYGIYETQTTVVISGCSNSDWFGIALGNIGPTNPSPDDEEDGTDVHHTSEHSDTEVDPEPQEDFFATGGCEPVLNPENTIWDPRIYFLQATRIRLSVTTRSSEYLVRKLDAACHDWVSSHCAYAI